MSQIYFSQDPNVNVAQNFFEYIKFAEKSYDKEKIIEWINSHETVLGDKKVWLLTGQAYEKSYEEWEKWLVAEGYQVVIDCRGFGQVLLGESKFRYHNIEKQLSEKGIEVYSLSKD